MIDIVFLATLIICGCTSLICPLAFCVGCSKTPWLQRNLLHNREGYYMICWQHETRLNQVDFVSKRQGPVLEWQDPEENPYKSKYVAREMLELAAPRWSCDSRQFTCQFLSLFVKVSTDRVLPGQGFGETDHRRGRGPS